MGVDISSHAGVVIAESDLAGIIREDNVARARQALLRCMSMTFDKLKSANEGTPCDEWELATLRRNARLCAKRFEQLDQSSSAEDVRSMLLSVTKGVADGADSRVENSELAIAIWTELIKELFPGSPTPEDTVFIGAPRYQGWDLPAKEVLYVFPEDECFERVKTEKGKMLDKMLGEDTELSQWTSYSC